MEGLYSGAFVGYRQAREEDLDEALRSAVVAVDANVLLDLYRYRKQTSDDLISTLEAIGARLVVPHQALREFWRHRSRNQASSQGTTSTAVSAIEKSGRSLSDTLQGWAKQIGVPAEELEQLEERVAKLIDHLTSELYASNPVPDGAADEILERLESLLDGHVTEALAAEEHDSCLEEARRRIDAEIPPGYKDAGKEDNDSPDGGAGDYLVWYQATKFAKQQQQDLIIVTRDEKEDWWWRQRSKFLGPRPELTFEYHAMTGRRLYLMRPSDLLARANSALSVAVDAASSEDASRISEVVEDVSDGWTFEAVAALLSRLDAEAPVQAAALRLAEETGRVTREQVYELGGYPDERTLRGFTRPIRRITQVLQDDGIVPDSVRTIFVARYPDGVMASYFSTPPEVPDILADISARESGAD